MPGSIATTASASITMRISAATVASAPSRRARRARSGAWCATRACSGAGNLWIGTARGVDRFDGARFMNYGTSEGYASAESNAGGFFADRDGTLWFGTAGGLSHYDPSQDRTPLQAPRLCIERLVLGGD